MKILVSDPLSEEGLNILKENGFSVDVKANLTPEELKNIVGGYDALIIRSGTRVTEDIVNACDLMKVIGRAGVGVDNVDVAAATQKGIVVMNTPGGNTISTAEHTVSMMLALNRNIPQANISLKNGEWNRKKFRGKELLQKTLGIIGLGRIGVEVAKRAQSFGMKIVAFDPFLSSKKAPKLDIELIDLDDLFKRSDYITVHTPLTDDTRHLISKNQFLMMKKGVKILNCARGGIIDEKALYDAINEGIVSAAALDVFEQEPPQNNDLIGLDCVIVTPHLGAATDEAQVNVAVDIANQVSDMLNGKGIRNAVNYPSVEGETCAILEPYIRLAEKLGMLQTQIITGHINKVSIKYGGEIVNQDVASVTIALIKGMLTPILQESVNYVNAKVIAKDRGILVSETKVLDTEEFANLIAVDVETDKGMTSVSGTLFTCNIPRIVKINDFYVDAIPEGIIIITHNLDKPGIIGQIGTILGQVGINIAAMNFGRTEQEGESLVVLNVDSEVSLDVLEKIRQSDSIMDVRLIRL